MAMHNHADHMATVGLGEFGTPLFLFVSSRFSLIL